MKLVLIGKLGRDRGCIAYFDRHEEFQKFHQYLQEGIMRKLWDCEDAQSGGGVGEGFDEILKQGMDTLSEK